MRDHVFLSYASDDLELVQLIYDGLKKRNLKVWFDKGDVKRGPWRKQIMKAIARSRFFVFCISNAALKKTGGRRPSFQDQGLNRAFEIAIAQPIDEFTIVPIRIEDCERGAPGARLTTFQRYDLLNDFEIGLDKLSIDLGGISLSNAHAKDKRSEYDKIKESLIGKAETLYHAGDLSKSLLFLSFLTEFTIADKDVLKFKNLILNDLKMRKGSVPATKKGVERKTKSALGSGSFSITGLKEGREDDYRALIFYTTPSLMNYLIKRYYLSKQDAEDIIQEAFIKLIDSIQNIKDKEHLKNWLYHITRNITIHRLKESQRDYKGVERCPERFYNPSEIVGKEHLGNGPLLYKSVLGAIEKLPEHDRELIEKRYFLDLANSEIATEMGLPLGTVKNRLSRLKKKIKKELEVDELIVTKLKKNENQKKQGRS